MNINKIIAGAIFIFTYAVPFRMLYFTEGVYNGGKYTFLLLAVLIGYYAGFAIATNKPFGRKEAAEDKHDENEYEHEHRQAA